MLLFLFLFLLISLISFITSYDRTNEILLLFFRDLIITILRLMPAMIISKKMYLKKLAIVLKGEKKWLKWNHFTIERTRVKD